MGWPMSRQPPSPALPGSSRHEHPNLGILLRIPFQEVVRRVSAGLAEAGFTDLRPAHTAVFQHIDVDGSRLTDLAERAQITKQSMGYLVDYLEQHGYLERRADPSDRRASLVCLTERGWAQIQTALAIIATLEEDWTRALGNEQMRQLRKLLSQLAQTAET
jgi:DNA-binding MarR family transcriptional regulator